MSDAIESKSTPVVPIVVSSIGVIGSIAVAWITTQTKFANELQSKEAEVHAMKQDLMAMEQRLLERQREIDAKVEVIDDRLKKNRHAN